MNNKPKSFIYNENSEIWDTSNPPSQSNAHEDVHVRQNSLGPWGFISKNKFCCSDGLISMRLLYAPAELDIRMKVKFMELPSSETQVRIHVAKSL